MVWCARWWCTRDETRTREQIGGVPPVACAIYETIYSCFFHSFHNKDFRSLRVFLAGMHLFPHTTGYYALGTVCRSASPPSPVGSCCNVATLILVDVTVDAL